MARQKKVKKIDFIPENNPHIISVIKGLAQEYTNSKNRISAEKNLIAEMLDDKSDELGIDKKVLRQVVDAHYRSNLQTKVETTIELKRQYEAVFGVQPEVAKVLENE